MSAVDWGDVPAWFGGAFGALAFGAAAWTLKSQRDQISEQRVFIGEQSATMALERAELRAAAEDRKWAQARQIHMLLGTDGYRERTDRGSTIGYDRWSIKVHNASDAPIRGVMMRFGDAYNAASATEAEARHLPDGGRRTVPVYLLGGGRTIHFESPQWQEVTVDQNRPVLYFTDDAGVRWRRDEYGHLKEEPPQAQPGT
ncbi:hypothetical protein [Streptomyces sp. NPDC047070]|uniref:hypothetical protein n=1 Tax=Streptomyces sp. NPDC047070 TaxID=3154923 RepID=UPI0034551643